MKSITKTQAEKDLHDDLRDMGCCVCRFITKPDVDELRTPSIHHIEGKTKKGSHRIVIPLCDTHHQYGTKEHPSIHANGTCGGKAQFRSKYKVDEYDLLALCEEELGYQYKNLEMAA